MILSKKLINNEYVKHGFFTRKNGFSKNLYKSLNCGLGSNDKILVVKKNLKLVSKKIGCKLKNLITMKQTHSTKVIFIKKINPKKNIICDALLTNQKKIAIAVLTADCVPILIYEPEKKIIGVIHAGWKGAFKGIIAKTLKKIKFDKKKIIISIGPCIGKKNYEVRFNFYKRFINQSYFNKKFFTKKKNKKYLFDLRAYVNMQVKKIGIKNIENINKDTFKENKSFFSYRRSLFNNEADYGRNISVIMIN